MSTKISHYIISVISVVLVFLISSGQAYADSPLAGNPPPAGNTDTTRHGKQKRLAVINSYNENTPWPRLFINSIISEMALHKDFEPVKVAHLNNSLIRNKDEYDALETRLFDFFDKSKPDYLIVIGNFAFTMRDMFKKHWGNIPILLLSQNNMYADLDYYFTVTDNDDSKIPPKMYPMEDLQKEYNFTSLITRNKYRETIDMMVEMYPDMKKIVFMGIGIYANRHLSFLIREYLGLKYPDMQYEWLLAGEDGSMVPYINNTDPNVGLLLSNWSYASTGLGGETFFRSGDSYLIKGARRPVFGLRYSYFNYGILGGYFDDVNEFNAMVMDGLSQLISDTDMSQIPFKEPEYSPYIDYEKMKKLEIPESDCPEGTIFINRKENKWETYRGYVYAGAISLIVVIVALIIYIVTRKRPIIRRDYDNLVNSMPLGFMQVLMVLGKDGKIKKIEYSERNRHLREIIEEYNLRDAIKDDSNTHWQETVDIIRTDYRTKEVTVRVPDSDTYFDFIICPDKHSNNNYFCANIFVIDVSDKMRIENVLRDTAKKAIEADNMKTAFLANMSHEIRTPLNAIVGFSHLLCRTNDRKKMDQFIDIIETNNQLLLKLIGDVLDISKADSNKLQFNMQTVDINAIIDSSCRSIDMSQKSDVRLEKNLPMDKCMVTSDPYRLQQVLGNMLTNALKFTERGYVEVGYSIEGDFLRLYVKDTGLGFSESEKSKLFTRFTKLNAFVQGTGLGLSISKAIVEKLGGQMKAESAGRGKGSVFHFTIPFRVENDSDSSSDSTPAEKKSDEERVASLRKKVNAKVSEYGNIIVAEESALPHSPLTDPGLPSYKHEKKKILVVEDNSSNYMLIEEIIDGRAVIVHAWDGEEAVRMFAREAPDIVLMDINLPQKNGYEAAAEIRVLSKTVPIIAVTAYAQDTDKDKIIQSGFNGYIAKPVVEKDLHQVLKHFL